MDENGKGENDNLAVKKKNRRNATEDLLKRNGRIVKTLSKMSSKHCQRSVENENDQNSIETPSKLHQTSIENCVEIWQNPIENLSRCHQNERPLKQYQNVVKIFYSHHRKANPLKSVEIP
ncbi:hypothetical protein PanWU01x14_325180 [Parasponia andersonii]|uniref:Uncharacterized protein n=1 Tax=Parasponia andersonii TaxID=3476 RepID=A0A2P5AJV2_PARAD|nr:hypothetical protein PanWU01x14_325180 [Parasponia andersonii]